MFSPLEFSVMLIISDAANSIVSPSVEDIHGWPQEANEVGLRVQFWVSPAHGIDGTPFLRQPNTISLNICVNHIMTKEAHSSPPVSIWDFPWNSTAFAEERWLSLFTARRSKAPTKNHVISKMPYSNHHVVYRSDWLTS